MNLRRLSSLYLEHNKVSSLKVIGGCAGLMSLSLSHNSITDIAPLDGLSGLYHLFLEGNKIRDLAPLVNMAKKDAEGEKRFAPFLNLYIKGNPVRRNQLSALRQFGVRVQE
mgnify:CR=1 FL=1